MILIKNGTVKTMAGPDIENGQVLIDGGKIVAVGKEVNAPADAQVIDAQGCLVAPGFVEAHCHIGLDEEAIGFEGDHDHEMTDPGPPQMRGNDDQKIAFGENPKRCYGASQKKMPMTRMGTAALLRELLVKAENYREEMDAYEQDPKNNKKPTYDCKLHAMLPVMRKEIPLKSHAHRADDIFTSLRIAKEFDLDITLDHCTEGHLIADELAKEGKPCLVGPTFGAKSKFELKNKCWDTPKVMVEHGLKTCIITDAPVIPLKYLPLCAGLAINAGLDEQEAWKAVTINPAEVAGIGDRVGSLEVGKDADVVVYQGNPLTDLQYTTKYTVINGEIVYKAE